MLAQEDLNQIILKMKNIYDNVVTIENQNEKMIETIDILTKKETSEKEKSTKIMPASCIY